MNSLMFRLGQRAVHHTATIHYARRTFATSRATLLELIQREHQEEVDEGRTEEPQELKDLRATIQKNAWRIVDDQGFTKLVRNHNSMKMQLSFHCQDMVTDSMEGDDDDDEMDARSNPEEQPPPQMEDEEDDYADEVPGSIRFTASATPTKTGKTLIFQCTSEFAGATIDAVAVSKDDDIEKLHTSDAKHNEYTGPVFAELAEDVRNEFQQFLEVDVGVDAEMAMFINTYADYKEQQQYVKFLKDVEEVLE